MSLLDRIPSPNGGNPVSIIRLPVRTRTAAEQAAEADRINAMRADIKAHNELHAQLQSEAQATTRRSGLTKESNSTYMANMSSIKGKTLQTQIWLVQNLIEEGVSNKEFFGYNGNERADSAEQYLSWLQTRVEELQSSTNSSSIDIEA
nr:hypothetical protein [uncultured Cohaesibacter sp.]